MEHDRLPSALGEGFLVACGVQGGTGRKRWRPSAEDQGERSGKIDEGRGGTVYEEMSRVGAAAFTFSSRGGGVDADQEREAEVGGETETRSRMYVGVVETRRGVNADLACTRLIAFCLLPTSVARTFLGALLPLVWWCRIPASVFRLVTSRCLGLSVIIWSSGN